MSGLSDERMDEIKQAALNYRTVALSIYEVLALVEMVEDARAAAREVFGMAELTDEEMDLVWTKHPWMKPPETILPPYVP